jgi:hypothetical protein
VLTGEPVSTLHGGGTVRISHARTTWRPRLDDDHTFGNRHRMRYLSAVPRQGLCISGAVEAACRNFGSDESQCRLTLISR